MGRETTPPDERAATEDFSGEDLSRGPTPETTRFLDQRWDDVAERAMQEAGARS